MEIITKSKAVKFSNDQKIGTHFKKQNIFLATICDCPKDTIELINTKFKSTPLNKLLKKLVESGDIASSECDIVYKDEKGYTRFDTENPKTFIGDNSDGKGFIQNVTSIWDYYSEEEVREVMIDNRFMAIGVTNDKPISRYNKDYNNV